MNNKTKDQEKGAKQQAVRPVSSAFGAKLNQHHAVGLNSEKDSAPASHALIEHQ